MTVNTPVIPKTENKTKSRIQKSPHDEYTYELL